MVNLAWSQYDVILNRYADQVAIPPSPNVIFSENSTNIGLFGSVNYDLTTGTTLSLDTRFQTEDVTKFNEVTNEALTNSTDSFLRRVAGTHTFDNNVTVYMQAAQSNNSAGVIPAAHRPRLIETHAQSARLGLINWSQDSVLRNDEEVITNLKFGIKANLAENQAELTSAPFSMDCENYNQPFSLNWSIDTLWAQTGSSEL